jgi:hypothetical protein
MGRLSATFSVIIASSGRKKRAADATCHGLLSLLFLPASIQEGHVLGADADKLSVEKVRVHEEEDTQGNGRFAIKAQRHWGRIGPRPSPLNWSQVRIVRRAAITWPRWIWSPNGHEKGGGSSPLSKRGGPNLLRMWVSPLANGKDSHEKLDLRH